MGAPETEPSRTWRHEWHTPLARHPDADFPGLRLVQVDLDEFHRRSRGTENRGEHRMAPSESIPGRYQIVQPPSITMSWPVR